MRFTLATLDAVVGLAHTWYGTVETNEIVASQLIVFVIHLQAWQRAVVLTFIIMYEDGGDVDAVRTGHAVFAVVAGNILQTYDALGNILVQETLLFLSQWYQWTV
jgi:hypothetical protein